MRTSLIRTAIVVAGLALAAPAFAAYNDVTLGNSAVVNVGGIELDVTSSAASIESITVNSDNFTINLQSGSSLAVSAPGLNQIFAGATDSNITVTTVCTASASTVTISSTMSGTVTVTPVSATCPIVTTTTNSGGGGNGAPVGGGSGGAVGATPTIPAQATQAGSPSQSAQGTKFAALTKVLAKGSKGASVTVLQQMLNADPDTQISLSGAGSPGSETTLFGNATLAAIKKFQVKWGIAKPGDQAYGSLGPKTRAKLNALFAK